MSNLTPVTPGAGNVGNVQPGDLGSVQELTPSAPGGENLTVGSAEPSGAELVPDAGRQPELPASPTPGTAPNFTAQESANELAGAIVSNMNDFDLAAFSSLLGMRTFSIAAIQAAIADILVAMEEQNTKLQDQLQQLIPLVRKMRLGAAAKMRDQANWQFAGAIIGSVAGIAMGAYSMKMAGSMMKASDKMTKLTQDVEAAKVKVTEARSELGAAQADQKLKVEEFNKAEARATKASTAASADAADSAKAAAYSQAQGEAVGARKAVTQADAAVTNARANVESAQKDLDLAEAKYNEVPKVGESKAQQHKKLEADYDKTRAMLQSGVAQSFQKVGEMPEAWARGQAEVTAADIKTQDAETEAQQGYQQSKASLRQNMAGALSQMIQTLDKIADSQTRSAQAGIRI